MKHSESTFLEEGILLPSAQLSWLENALNELLLSLLTIRKCDDSGNT
jgi:hypothetical protein